MAEHISILGLRSSFVIEIISIIGPLVPQTQESD